MPNQTYWIIVSDEGPSTLPVRHTSFEEAKTESFRLAKLRPDLKFGVFEHVGTASATPKKKTVTKWMGILNGTNGGFIPGADFFDTKYEVEQKRSPTPNLYHGEPVPVPVEIDVDQSVVFEVPNVDPTVEYRFYRGVPTWGFLLGETFFPFSSKQEAEQGAKHPERSYAGRPVSECPLASEISKTVYSYYPF